MGIQCTTLTIAEKPEISILDGGVETISRYTMLRRPNHKYVWKLQMCMSLRLTEEFYDIKIEPILYNDLNNIHYGATFSRLVPSWLKKGDIVQAGDLKTEIFVCEGKNNSWKLKYKVGKWPNLTDSGFYYQYEIVGALRVTHKTGLVSTHTSFGSDRPSPLFRSIFSFDGRTFTLNSDIEKLDGLFQIRYAVADNARIYEKAIWFDERYWSRTRILATKHSYIFFTEKGLLAHGDFSPTRDNGKIPAYDASVDADMKTMVVSDLTDPTYGALRTVPMGGSFGPIPACDGGEDYT